MNAKSWMTGALVLAAMVGCRPDDQRTDTVDAAAIEAQREQLAPEVRMHLDSGNAAFRRNDPQGALDHFNEAIDLDPDAAAAWFGIYMAQQALGNEEAAQEAMERARSSVPGASLLQPSTADTAR